MVRIIKDPGYGIMEHFKPHNIYIFSENVYKDPVQKDLVKFLISKNPPQEIKKNKDDEIIAPDPIFNEDDNVFNDPS